MLASKPKRLLSLLLVLVMLLGLIPTGVFAAGPTDAETTQRTKQIAYEGGTLYYDKDGKPADASDYAVKLTKTVNPTGTENRFTINLEVETRQNIEELEAAPDAAVVLVIDASSSMNTTENIWDEERRVDKAKKAAQAFLETYVEDAGDAQRKVAVVEFGTNAKTLLNWTEANAGGTVNPAVTAAVDSVEPGFTYNYCTQKGVHTCTIDCAVHVTSLTLNAFEIEGSAVDPVNVKFKCKVCGYSGTGINNMDHSHCLECKEKVVRLDEHKHTFENVDGPHLTNYDEGATNMEGGLMLARNLLMAGQEPGGEIADIKNTYVIFLTDGKPETCLPEDQKSTDVTTEVKGIPAGTVIPSVGKEVLRIAHLPVPGMAADIQARSGAENPVTNPAKLFAVGFYTERTTIDSDNSDPLNEKKTDLWLQENVQVDRFFSANNGEEVSVVFEGIAQLIKTMANAWIVTDPIPKDGYVTYAENNTFEASKHAQWDPQNNQVVWDLKQMTPEPGDDEGTFVYKLSYDVILHPEVKGFAEEKPYPTNGQAQLSYLMLNEDQNLDDMTPEEITALLKTVNFETPEVKGYLGQFDFMKYAAHKDSANQDIPLSGAKFSLSNQEAAQLDKSAGAITKDATSKSGAQNETPKGQVEFTSIPSGYTYTLSETGEFESDGKTYTPTSDTWDVTVSYGEVTGGPADGVVRNTIKQEDLPLTLTKTWQAPTTAEIKVDVYRKDVGTEGDGERIATLTLNGNTCSSDPSDAVKVTYDSAKSTDKQWVYTLTVDKYNQATGGEYTYTVKEQPLEGYESKVEGLSITNTATGKTSVYVEKKWLDIDDQPMENPPAVQVQLFRSSDNVSDQLVETVTLNADGNWEHRWDNLDQ